MYIPRQRLFWAVSLGHFTNDTFMSMGPVLLAYLSVTLLPMTNTQIGFAVSIAQLMGAISQPLFGWLADKTGGRWLGSIGVGWTVTMLALALLGAQTGVYLLMFIPYALRALGSGAFHPVGALHAAESDDERVASNMAFFFLMGQFGLAFGPAIAGILLDMAAGSTVSTALAPFFALALAALIPVILMLISIPASAAHKAKHVPIDDAADRPKAREIMAGLPWKAFGILGVMVALRSLAQPGSVTFIPVLFQEKGWDPTQYGLITSFFWLASGFAGVFFGQLADRYDRRRVMMWSLLSGSIAFFLLPLFDNGMAFVLAILAGGLTGGSHSIIVVLAQELIPASKGLASGTILGFIFGTGALGSLIMGGLSDVIGLPTTFQIAAVTTVIAALLTLALPARAQEKPKRIPLDDAEPVIETV